MRRFKEKLMNMFFHISEKIKLKDNKYSIYKKDLIMKLILFLK